MIGELTAKLTAENGVALDLKAQARFDEYFAAIAQANEHFNLTRILGEEDTARKHFYDSLALLWLSDLPKFSRCIDIGAGAGFPSIPLCIARPDISFTAVDSVGKKVRFLSETAQALGLEQFEAVHGRCEDLAKSTVYRERYELCVARAVASLPTLLELALPFVKVGGLFAAYKGPMAYEELESAQKALDALGGIAETVPYTLPGDEGERVMVFVRKTRPCPAHFPRKAPLPAQKPIGC